MAAKFSQNSGKWPLLISLVLLLSTAAVFGPVINCDFVNYDDLSYVTTNNNIQHGLTWKSITWAFTTGACSNWHPLTWLSHILDYQLFGLKPTGHHLTSALFHLANVLLLFAVFRRLTGTLWRSAFIAGLFALHPLRVESVAWVSERKDVLSTFFFLLTLWAYHLYTRGNASEPKQLSWSARFLSRFYLLALAFFAFGLMAKPMLVTLPFVLLLLDYWPLRRFSFPIQRGEITSLILEKGPFLALAFASSVATFLVQRHGGAVSSLAGLGVIERICNAFVAYVRYIGKTLWPSKLSILYPHPGTWPLWQVIGAIVVLLLITALVMRLLQTRPYLAVGWCLFLGMLVPTIGLVQVGIQSMADRYTYIPIIGLLIMIAWGACDLLLHRPGGRVILGLAGGLAFAACLTLTPIQVGYWKNSETLFRHAIEVTEKNYLACNNLGYYFSNKGEIEKAMVYYTSSLQINPAYEEAHNNLGYALAALGRYDEAVVEYQRALKIKPDLAEAHNNLGNALSNLGKLEEAIAEYLITLKLNPQHADAHNNYGIALAMKGQLAEAVEHFHLAVRYKPNYASAHSNLGNAYAVQNKLDDAIREYYHCLRLEPKDPQAHNNLGNVLAQQNKFEEAIEHYQTSLRLKPQNPEAHFNLGFAYFRAAQYPKAEQHYLQALQQRPNYPQAQEQLRVVRAKLTLPSSS